MEPDLPPFARGGYPSGMTGKLTVAGSRMPPVEPARYRPIRTRLISARRGPEHFARSSRFRRADGAFFIFIN